MSATISGQPRDLLLAAGSNSSLVVTASGDFLTYQWSKDGVAIAGATSATLILGNVQASQTGKYTVTVGNGLGNVTSDAANVKVAAVRPSIDRSPVSQSVALAANVNLAVMATGDFLAFQWSKDGVAIGGATGATLALNNMQPAQAGTYTVTVSNPLGSITSATAEIKVAAVRATISQPPVGQIYFAGENVTLAVIAGGDLVAYQWSKDGRPIVGGTSATLKLGAFQAAQAGSYTVTVSNPMGSVTSEPAILALGSRLLNLSARTAVGTGGDILICGFVIRGGASRRVLVRAAGPRLSDFGVPDVLADPKLAVFDSAGKPIATNDDWSAAGAAAAQQLSDAFEAVGAFSFLPASKDAALIATLPPGAYTIQVSGANDSTGVALVEVYDSASAASNSTFANLSTRASVGTGGSILIQGLVVDGAAPKRLLVRAVGPRLADFGLNGILADPLLKIVNSAGDVVAMNDNWSAGDAAAVQAIAGAASSVGAFSLVDGSKDAALIVTLPAGAYTVQVSGVGDTIGTALVEVYSL